MSEPDRLQRVMGGDELRWLVDRMRVRLQRGAPLAGTVTLGGASNEQRRALERLLGRRAVRGRSLTVSLPALEEVLHRAGLAPDLRTAVEALTGPVPDVARELAQLDREWEHAMEPLRRVADDRPVLGEWVRWLQSTGLLRRAARGDPARARRLAEQAVEVVHALPAPGLPLGLFANRTGGDAHALDAGRPLSTVVLRAVAALGGVPEGAGAEWRRTAWTAVGVLSGELTNPVLTLNLPGDERSVTGRLLRVGAECGEPVHLSARQLVRDRPDLRALGGTAVYLCENPTVVAETANRLGSSSHPLVCTSTHPAAAATVLVRQLAEAGAILRYHGDFDWPGITIANGLVSRFRVSPWQMDADSYRRAAAVGGSRLAGNPVAAVWDPSLTPVMVEIGVKVEEERVLENLLDDLARRRPRNAGLPA